MKFLQLIVVLACLALASAIGAEDMAFLQSKNGFDYCPGSFGTGEWVAGECAGREQSPIDLPAMTGTGAPANAISATAGTASNCSVENNGHTLKYECGTGSLGSFAYKGATFNIKQFHVHFPSEHTFGGRKKDGEVHFVAFKSTANPKALARGDAIALGAMIDIVNGTQCGQATSLFNEIQMMTAPSNPSTKPCARVKIGAGGANTAAAATPSATAPTAPTAATNKALGPAAAPPGAATAPRKMMFRSLIQGMNKGHGARANVPNINLAATFAALVPSSTAQYEGSLTTPPCNQVVTHVVIVDKYLTICRDLVDKFTLDQVGINARPVQPANGRTPQYGVFSVAGGAATGTSSAATGLSGAAKGIAPSTAPSAAAPTAPAPNKPTGPAGTNNAK